MFESIAHSPSAWFEPTAPTDMPGLEISAGDPIPGEDGQPWRIEFAGPGHPVYDEVMAEVERENETGQQRLTAIATKATAEAFARQQSRSGRGKRANGAADTSDSLAESFATSTTELQSRRNLRNLARRCLGWTTPAVPDAVAWSPEAAMEVFTSSGFIWLQRQVLPWADRIDTFFAQPPTNAQPSPSTSSSSGRTLRRQAGEGKAA